MNCKICGQGVNVLFTKKVMHKYDVQYFQCSNCNFIQTEDTYWLDEAYQSAINFTDIGLISRNIVYSEIVTCLFRFSKFPARNKYLDYGAGYGMFVRMMRDNGFDFYWSDQYCENLYARKFEAEIQPAGTRYETVTAFEVFEHLVDPMKEVEKMLGFSDSILFSTELIRTTGPEIKDWWYIAAEHGQHIAFYDKKTLEFIANKFGLNLYTHKNLHFLTKKKISARVYKLATAYKFARLYNTFSRQKSLLQADHELYLKEEEPR